MQQSKGKSHVHDTVMLSGWLFADLFLALTIIFLSANTVGSKLNPVPTPTPEPRLDFNYQIITLSNVDYGWLLRDSPQVKDDLKRQIRRDYSFLQERSVGLVIAYGGANALDHDILAQDQARKIAGKVYGVLQELGQSGFAFQRASYYYPNYPNDYWGLFNPGQDPSTVIIHIFLFKQ